eukprot:jgi/Chlat1/2893/Chrsp2S00358
MASKLDKLEKREEGGPSGDKAYFGKPPGKQGKGLAGESDYARPEQLTDLRQICSFQNRRNTWYYRDRANRPRGPCELGVLRAAWINGIIDRDTIVWGMGLEDWAPLRNVYRLEQDIRTPEVDTLTTLKRVGWWVARRGRQ